jgi:pyridoxine 5-phosphate synthase
VVEAARICEAAGAAGITVHLREDRRHIQDRDVYALRKTVRSRLNLEMANSPEIVEIALKVRPHEVCIVPEKREELTTEGGLNVVGSWRKLDKSMTRLREAGIVISLFIEAASDQIRAAADLGAPCIEIHTGTYCNCTTGRSAQTELKKLIRGAELAHALGIRVNAGHGISLNNIDRILRMPHLDTLNIGHSIVCQSVFIGLRAAVKAMLAAMNPPLEGHKK